MLVPPSDEALTARELYRFFRAGEEETFALRGGVPAGTAR